MPDPNLADKTIWTGDSLDILRGMNSESVGLIYLDSPFNSNRNYAAPLGSKAAGAAFKDTWTLSGLDGADSRRTARAGLHAEGGGVQPR
jgi:site-specific DNA-methyltransferase (adenine-specific)